MSRRYSSGKDHSRSKDAYKPPNITSTISLPNVSVQQEPIHGECHAFCPINEELERRQTQELSRFEYPTEKLPTLVAVKKYRRAAAGRDVLNASKLRPAPVLLRTLRHLFTTVLKWPQSGFDSGPTTKASTLRPLQARPDEFLAVYYFVNDRVRSVRQDFTVQRVEGASLVIALQQAARFYLVARLLSVQLLGDKKSAQDWSDKLNDEQLRSALSQLQALYGQHKLNKFDHEVVPELMDSGEFVAYDVLLHINEPQDVACMLRTLSSKLRGLPMVQRALRAFVAYQTDDFLAFFVVFDTMTVLERAALLHHLSRVWTRSLRMINKAFGKQDRFPLKTLVHWMNLVGPHSTSNGIELVASLCNAMNIQTQRRPPESSPPRSGAGNVADSWENIDQLADQVVSLSESEHSFVEFATFKVAPLHDQLDSDTVQLLLRNVALEMVNIISDMDSLMTATQWIMGTACGARQIVDTPSA
uniref:SAC3/GANP/THP3 conserved domain-containing protein n=1 Tax=Hyaloperonospora arabidopsidis (strain Emoy2) TaxID=559515 RepID=M4C0K8_HYAAE